MALADRELCQTIWNEFKEYMEEYEEKNGLQPIDVARKMSEKYWYNKHNIWTPQHIECHWLTFTNWCMFKNWELPNDWPWDNDLYNYKYVKTNKKSNEIWKLLKNYMSEYEKTHEVNDRDTAVKAVRYYWARVYANHWSPEIGEYASLTLQTYLYKKGYDIVPLPHDTG